LPKKVTSDRYYKLTKKIISPQKAVELLKQGNQRFVSRDMIERDHQWHIRETLDSQHPFAIILGCIDSRVEPSIIFDQGIGDLFITRIGGNVVNDDIIGSMEYACAVVGSKLIVVLGHTSCGAVKGACDNVQLGKLTNALKPIRLAVESITTPEGYNRSSKNLDFVNQVARVNVEMAIENIKKQSDILQNLYLEGKIDIVGAIYNHRTGEVVFGGRTI